MNLLLIVTLNWITKRTKFYLFSFYDWNHWLYTPLIVYFHSKKNVIMLKSKIYLQILQIKLEMEIEESLFILKTFDLTIKFFLIY